jgi:hypothetical protein
MHSRIPLMTNRDVFSGSSNVSTPLSHGDDRKREREEPDDLGLFTWRALSEWCLCQTLASVAAGGRVGVPRHVPPRDRKRSCDPLGVGMLRGDGGLELSGARQHFHPRSLSRAAGCNQPSRRRRAGTCAHVARLPSMRLAMATP